MAAQDFQAPVSNRTCQICWVNDATHFCNCQGSPTLFCIACVGTHYGKDLRIIHQAIPIAALGKNLEEYERQSKALKEAIAALRSNLELVDKCCQEFDQMMKMSIDYFTEFRRWWLHLMQTERESLSAVIEAAILETMNCQDQGVMPVSALGKALLILHSDELKVVHYSITLPDLPALLQACCSYRSDLQVLCERFSLSQHLEAMSVSSTGQDQEEKKSNSEFDAVKSVSAGSSLEGDRLSGLRSKEEDYQRQFEQLQAAQVKVKRLTTELDILCSEAAASPAKDAIESLQAKINRKSEKLRAIRIQLEVSSKDKAQQIAELVKTNRLESDKMKEMYAQSFHNHTEDIKKTYEGMLAALKAERDKLKEKNDCQAEKIAEVHGNWEILKKKLERMKAEKNSEVELRQKLNYQYQDQRAKFEKRECDIDDLSRLVDSLRRKACKKDIASPVNAPEKDLPAISKKHFLKDSEQHSSQRYSDKERLERVLTSTSMKAQSRISLESGNEPTVIERIVIRSDQNPILEKIAPLRDEAPMTYTNVWKLFESLMEEKIKVNRLDLLMGRQPRPMDGFMVDFMYLHYGLKSLALKQLKALVKSLQELYENRHPYGILFTRFLSLFHPHPISSDLEPFLLVAQEEFTRIANQNPLKSEGFSELYNILQYGGCIPIVDAIEIVARLFRNARESCERVIAQMQPGSEEETLEITLVKVCGTLARMGKNSDYIFDMLDTDNSGSIEYYTFVDGLRLTLGIWINQNEGEVLCGFIDEDGVGTVSRTKWMQNVDFGAYVAKTTSRAYMISKSAFLNALVDEYEYEVRQHYYRVRSLIKGAILDKKAALNVLAMLDPLIDERSAVQLFEEAKTENLGASGGVSSEAFCVVILRNRVGGFGVVEFGIFHTALNALD